MMGRVFTVGDKVRVRAAIDREIYDVSELIGKVGEITERLDEDTAPFIVNFSRPVRPKTPGNPDINRSDEAFWADELELVWRAS